VLDAMLTKECLLADLDMMSMEKHYVDEREYFLVCILGQLSLDTVEIIVYILFLGSHTEKTKPINNDTFAFTIELVCPL
jgi:hypothetical protein